MRGPDPVILGLGEANAAAEKTVGETERASADLLDRDLVGDEVMQFRRLVKAHRESDRGNAVERLTIDGFMGVDADRKQHHVQPLDHPSRVIWKEDDPGRVAIAPVQPPLVAESPHLFPPDRQAITIFYHAPVAAENRLAAQ